MSLFSKLLLKLLKSLLHFLIITTSFLYEQIDLQTLKVVLNDIGKRTKQNQKVP